MANLFFMRQAVAWYFQHPPAQKKQALVALARTFGLDWWRISTERTTAEKLGLVMGSGENAQ